MSVNAPVRPDLEIIEEVDLEKDVSCQIGTCSDTAGWLCLHPVGEFTCSVLMCGKHKKNNEKAIAEAKADLSDCECRICKTSGFSPYDVRIVEL